MPGYVSGSALNPPLDFYQFPRLLGDVSVLKKEVVGNPMYVSWFVNQTRADRNPTLLCQE